MNLVGVDATVQQIVFGVVLLLAILLSSVQDRLLRVTPCQHLFHVPADGADASRSGPVEGHGLGLGAGGRAGGGEVAHEHLVQPPIALMERSGWT